MDRHSFIQRVKHLYLMNPGAVSSIAYHKLEGFLRESELHHLDGDGRETLYAIRQRQLTFYWSEQQDRFMVPPEQLQQLESLILHEQHYLLLRRQLSGYSIDQFYPLFYDHSFQQPAIACESCYIDGFDFRQELDYEAAAEIITGTRTGYTLTAERVRGWTRDRAFDPTLWLLAREKHSGRPVGVGISCYFAPVGEADLDWFFVRPSHQGQGVGRMLIAETIARCQPKSKIIRLAGIADGFYQKCGFRRGDSWYYLKKQRQR
jgi:GNAT superfamily N-acetyltransferase